MYLIFPKKITNLVIFQILSMKINEIIRKNKMSEIVFLCLHGFKCIISNVEL